MPYFLKKGEMPLSGRLLSLGTRISLANLITVVPSSIAHNRTGWGKAAPK